mmetsp:Transcript_55591/g.130221  ORF Transcript_55591/g.130221 Transcript_55591/m.130221 type:complete len:140 (-) Transcript_55591:174-593(-)
MLAREKAVLVSIMLGMLAVIGCLTLVSQRKSHAVALLQPLMKPAVFEEVPMQSLVYIPRPAANPGDYSEFRNMCISACESSMIYDTTEKCGAAALGGHWITYVDACRVDPCACEISMMYCGGEYKTHRHPDHAQPGLCV